MKLLIQILLALLLAAGLFVLLGVVSKSQTTKNSVVVNAPVEYCWSAFHDTELMHHWMPGFKSRKLMDGSANSANARYIVLLEENDNSKAWSGATEVEQHVSIYEAPRRYKYSYTSDFLEGEEDLTFTMRDSLTQVESINRFSGSSLLLRSTLALFGSSIDNRTQSQFENFKLMVESTYSASIVDTTTITLDSLDINID